MTESKKKITVMQLLPALESGGVERGAIDVAKALQNEGFEPIVVSKGGVLVYQLREAGITHITMPIHSKNPLKILCNARRLVKIIAEHKVDILHARSRAPMWSAYFACKKTKTKLVSTVHGPYSLGLFGFKNFILKRAYNKIMLRADRIIAVSNFIRRGLLKNYKGDFSGRITVIQRGADLNYFNPKAVSNSRVVDLITKWHLPEDQKIILLPARFTAWKGHEFFIEALSKVKNDFYCIMVGSDHGHKAFRKKIEQLIIKKGLAGKVRVAGLCKDMQTTYAISNIVVCPSVRPEAFGRVPIESQASAKITIATKIGGALDTIIEDKTGFLVEVGDTQKFAELIDNALAMSKAESTEMGDEARKNIEDNFSNEKMCRLTLDIYRELIEGDLIESTEEQSNN